MQDDAADGNTDDPAGERRYHRLDQELSRDLRRRGAKRDPRRELALTARRSHQRQVGDVDRADEQHECGTGPQQVQRAANRTSQRLLQRCDGGVHPQPFIIELREAPHGVGVQRVELRPHLLDRGLGAESANVEIAVACAPAVGFLFRREGQRNPELDVARIAGMPLIAAIEEREIRRHHANDGVGLAGPPESQRLSECIRSATVELLPQTVTDDDLLIVANLAFVVRERPSSSWFHPQHPEQRRCDAHAANLLRDPSDRQRVVPEREHRLLFERGQCGQPVEGRRHVVRQDVVRRNRRIDVAHADDAIGFGDRKRPEQHRVHHGEDGGVGAQAHAERQHDGSAEARRFDELPHSVANIARDAAAEPTFRRWREAEDCRLGVEQFGAERVPVGDLMLQLAPGLGIRQAIGAKALVNLVELVAPLVDNLLFALRRQTES